MLMRKSIGAVLAAGAMVTALGLAGCADNGTVGTGYASGYGSGYANQGDYWPGYDTLGYSAGAYDGSGYDALGYDAGGYDAGGL
jgi:hypothetical protein